MITLRPYQQKCVDEIRQALSNGEKGVMCCAPCGAGKSILIAALAKLATEKGKKVLILTDRIELLQGNSGALKGFDLYASKIVAGKNSHLEGDCLIAMSQTLKRRMEKPEFKKMCEEVDLLLIDEAQKCEFDFFFKDYDKEINVNQFFRKDCKIVGFSATPIRRGKQPQLAEFYTKIVYTPDVQELISMGMLSPSHDYIGAHESMDGVKITKGDYDEGEQFNLVNKSKVYDGVIENWQRICPGTISLVFCVNIAHAAKMCKTFNDAGVPSKFICSQTPEGFERYTGNRSAIIDQWKRGEFKVLVNANIFAVGFNHPPIETVCFVRSTTSKALWLQAIGRGSRTSPGKTHFNVLDFGGNISNLGTYSQNRDWSLIHKTGKTGEARFTECEKCYAYISASSKICPFCGHKRELTVKEKIEVELVRYKTLSEKDAALSLDWNDPKQVESIRTAKSYLVGWIVYKAVAALGRDGAYDFLKQYATYRNKAGLGKVKNVGYWASTQVDRCKLG